MIKTMNIWCGVSAIVLAFSALPAAAQSFRVQCPNGTATHPSLDNKVDSMIATDPKAGVGECRFGVLPCNNADNTFNGPPWETTTQSSPTMRIAW